MELYPRLGRSQHPAMQAVAIRKRGSAPSGMAVASQRGADELQPSPPAEPQHVSGRSLHLALPGTPADGPRAADADEPGHTTQGGSVAEHLLEAMDRRQKQHQCQTLWACWTFTFKPDDTFRIGWDIFMLGLVIFSCFMLPYKTAFELEETLKHDPSSLGMDWSDWAIDVLFYIDLGLNFWTAYSTGYAVVTDKWLIAKNYLGSSFFIDLVATVEWDILAKLMICGSGGCVGELRQVGSHRAGRGAFCCTSLCSCSCAPGQCGTANHNSLCPPGQRHHRALSHAEGLATGTGRAADRPPFQQIDHALLLYHGARVLPLRDRMRTCAGLPVLHDPDSLRVRARH